MDSGLKSVSRLTLIFIMAFIISGGVLTYFSISSISNLKELTEKKVLEEKNRLYRDIMETLETDIQNLTSYFSHQISSIGFNRDSLEKLQEYFPYYTFPFHYLDHGDFLYPYYIQNLTGSLDAGFSDPYCNYFNLGEMAEFTAQEMSSAENHYQKCLSLSGNKTDSARALNALARISVKSNKFNEAIRYYGRIIAYYPDITDLNGYPYSYYSISQLIKQDDLTKCDAVLSCVESWMDNMCANIVPMIYSTRPLINDILKWLDVNSFKDQEKLSLLESHIEAIDTRLKNIDQFGGMISENITNNVADQIHFGMNGYYFLENYNDDKGYLIAHHRDSSNHTGFVIDIDSLLFSVIAAKYYQDLEFEYNVEIARSTGSLFADTENQLLQLNPYISRYAIGIELSNGMMITEYVNTRRWIYGMALTVLLSGMLLAIMLILRDINRERQIAALKSDFISNVTHELKSPITSIRMFAESMLLGRVKNQTGKQEYLEIIMRESERLKRMINNILDFSRMENKRQKYRFEKKELSPLIKEVIEETDYWFHEKKIKLITEIDDNIFSNIDQEKIKQALGNLINNAIKYTPESKNIYIRLYNNGEHNKIEIEDQGIGIPEDQKNDIFKKFYRVSGNETEGISGTGLGLTVVKEIVDAHGWEIKVESKKGKGSRFTLIF